MTEPVALEPKEILHHNLSVFVDTIVAHALDGWKIDEKNPPNLVGYLYQTVLLKPEDEIDRTTTRADITANARSAKKVKAIKAAENDQADA